MSSVETKLDSTKFADYDNIEITWMALPVKRFKHTTASPTVQKLD